MEMASDRDQPGKSVAGSSVGRGSPPATPVSSAPRRRLEHQVQPGCHAVSLPRGPLTEVFLTFTPLPGEAPTALLGRLYDYLQAHPDLRILRQDVFGVAAADIAHTDACLYRRQSGEWPTTWIEDSPGRGQPVAGIQVHAVRGVPVHPISSAGRVLGAWFEDAHARYAILGDLRPPTTEAARDDQAGQTLSAMEAALRLVELDFSHVVRTWFYLEDILDWYAQFNRVRNAFFRERGVFERVVPASTGVGARNAAGSAVVADVLAVAFKDAAGTLTALPSPLQCSAMDYGSSFSRAVEVRLPDHRRIYVSGTASIAPEGRTEHVGAVEAQLDLTMRVVHAILTSAGMDWADVTRAIGYFKHGDDAPCFEAWGRAHAVPGLPAVMAKTDICRDDLLFEIEVDAMQLV